MAYHKIRGEDHLSEMSNIFKLRTVFTNQEWQQVAKAATIKENIYSKKHNSPYIELRMSLLTLEKD